MAASSRRVLISGAGIAGPVVSYWLGRAGIHSTIVERAPTLRTNGQTLDIRGKARDIIAKMGVEQAIRDATTQEEGMYVVNNRDQVLGCFPGGADSAVCDIEILRYKLVSILADAAKDTTEYIYGDCIKNITQTTDEAVVEFESGKRQAYDVVILADGMHSRARSLVFPKQGEPHGINFNSLGFMTAYFAIPYQPEDGTWSRVWLGTGNRSCFIRPDGKSDEPSTRAFFITRNPDALRKFANYRSMSTAEQKRVWREIYADAGWKLDRILDGMDASTGTDKDQFYISEIAQIKTDRWYAGRVVLVGDAGYTPSPMSGMGTSAAIVGSYVLATELARQPRWDAHGVQAALASYDAICRPYIEKLQQIPLWVARSAHPTSGWQLAALQTAVRLGSAVLNSTVLRWVGNTVSAVTGGKKEEEDDAKAAQGDPSLEKMLKLPAYYEEIPGASAATAAPAPVAASA